jgi:hypothetical protein
VLTPPPPPDWRNHVNRPSQPIEDAYRSTYNNIYTNGPKMVRDALTGQIRWITPYVGPPPVTA